MNDEIIILTDENGEEEKFKVIASLEISDKEYAILQPEHEEERALVFKVDKSDDEVELSYVDNKKVMNQVISAYKELVNKNSEE